MTFGFCDGSKNIRRSSWSVSWRKLENFLGTTWQRAWRQRLRRAGTKVHLDIGESVWRLRSRWGLEQHLDAAAMPDRNLTRKHVGCDREKHWLMRKRARVRERSEQELDRLQKWPWSSNSQQRWCCRNSQHHRFPVLLRRCKNWHNTFRTSKWMVEWLLWTSSASEIPSACSFGECKFPSARRSWTSRS